MKGRPGKDEASAYYQGYIAQVAGDDVIAALEKQQAENAPLFKTISEEKSLHRYEPEKWSIRQMVNHLSDVERLFGLRLLWFARGLEAPLPSYDQNIAETAAESDRIAWAEHVEEFRRVRMATLSLLRHLPEAAWMRSGVASGNPFTVRAMAYVIAGHEVHHVRILREKYL